ncbi:DUF2059 domain-containing protein [Flavobacterium sp.]|jgi:hypothetical protein|uniref:DUF2059 domain-containing protein n=1 Tax=Flavobacterium sp. TaxID=239 RepID=UPI00391DC27C
MKKLLVAVAFAFVTHVGFAQDEAFKKDVLRVIEMSGATNQMKSAKNQILQMVPKEKQAAFIIEFDSTLPSLYDKMATIYMEEYSKEDIKAMIAFYESPVGKKINEKSGVILEKSQAAGQEWGQGLQTMMMKYAQ